MGQLMSRTVGVKPDPGPSESSEGKDGAAQSEGGDNDGGGVSVRGSVCSAVSLSVSASLSAWSSVAVDY